MILLLVGLFLAPNLEIKLDEVTLSAQVPPGWTKLEPEAVDGGEMLGRWRDDATGRLATLVKAPGNTETAFDAKTQADFFAGVERGVRLQTPDFHKLSGGVREAKGKKKRLIVYDLWWKVPGAVRGARFLFFHGWSAVLIVETPGQKSDDQARAFVESFAASIRSD